MRYFVFILSFLMITPLVGYKQNYDADLDNEKYLNFLAAIQNRSTFSYFTVVKVKDLNTGLTKEICAKGNFVAGTLHREFNVGYARGGKQKIFDLAKSKQDRYFELQNKEALNNISFFDYSSELIDKIKAKYDFDKITEIIKRDESFSIQLSDDEMKAFAHILFNQGFLTGENNCFGGKLEFVDRTKHGSSIYKK